MCLSPSFFSHLMTRVTEVTNHQGVRDQELVRMSSWNLDSSLVGSDESMCSHF